MNNLTKYLLGFPEVIYVGCPTMITEANLADKLREAISLGEQFSKLDKDLKIWLHKSDYEKLQAEHIKLFPKNKEPKATFQVYPLRLLSSIEEHTFIITSLDMTKLPTVEMIKQKPIILHTIQVV